jgi:hypothetical protein
MDTTTLIVPPPPLSEDELISNIEKLKKLKEVTSLYNNEDDPMVWSE